MRILKIEWIDSANHATGWEYGVGHEHARITSVGMVARETRKAITLVQSRCTKGAGKGSENNAITIPKACIKKQQEI